jgi:hypothetical protein
MHIIEIQQILHEDVNCYDMVHNKVNKAVQESKKFLDWRSIKEPYHGKKGEVTNSETRIF